MVSKADLSQPVSWASVSAAFDVVLDMPEALRAGELTRIGREDPLLARELESLLAHVSAQDDLLDRLSTSSEPGAQALDSLSCGTRVGAYRIAQLLGRGGMGEVYLAERADGQYDQKVALKLMRRDVAELSPAFQDERQLLARLEHPGIARLLDGGLDDYGRPFMVMELIKGQPISAWCRDHKTTLAERLRLFIAVCDTVAYAHRSLIVHRDLKPANVLVTVDGEVKLLDFGIAKLMQRMDEELIPAPSNHLTPGYAAPELFTEGTITTAADIYALGMLMFELLTDDRPWRSSAMPVIAALRKVIWEAPSLPSDFAQRASHAPFPPRLLKGDLDAIFAKATDRNPALRYAAAKDLADDVRAVLEHRPVQARKAARLYLLQRFLRRHWIPVSAATAVFIALTMGILGIGWEAAQAQREAARATSTKDFLISVFEASDPRVASDTPRGEITARNLLDLSADRIKSEFAADPAVEISLLGTVSAIYDLMGEQARSDRLRLEQVRAARAFYGETHPVVIEGQLDEISTSLHKVDAATATRRLDEVDSLIRRGHLERSVERARWWNLKGQTLWSDPLAVGARQTAFQNAATLYAKIDPINENYPVALNELGLTYMYYGNYRDAIKCFNTARTAAQSERIADDSVQVTIERNLAVALAYDDQRSEGEAALERGRLIGVRTYGVHNRHYWEVAAALAKMIHEDGDRQRADQLFTELVSEVPGNDADFESAVDRSVGAKVRETYGAAFGRRGSRSGWVGVARIGHYRYIACSLVTRRTCHGYNCAWAMHMTGRD